MKTVNLRRDSRWPRPGLRRLGASVTAAIWLAAAHLWAGGATVTWISGGPNPDIGVPSGAGYVDGDITADAEYHTPCGLAVDLTGNYILLADRDNNAVRVLEFDINWTGTLLTMTNYVPVTNLFNQPVGVALDGFYNIFVLNAGKGTNGYVYEFDNNGEMLATNIAHLTNATGIALDTSDNIYVTASNTVYEVTAPGVSNVVATITAPGCSLGGIVFKRSGPTAGLLAVCDTGRNGILLINPLTGVVTTNAGFHGAGDFITVNDTSISNTAKFFQPSGIAEAGDGSLVVSDYSNHRVKVVRVTDGTVTNLYGVSSNYWSGTYPGFSGGTLGTDDGSVETVVIPDSRYPNADARQPNGMAFAPDGSLYVTEDYYHIIRHITGAGFLPPPPPPPATPTSPGALARYGLVTVSWATSAGATNYNIKRSATSGAETTIGSSTTSPYVDTNVVDGILYYYVVSALNTGGESSNSIEVSAMPLFSPAPTNLFVVATNVGSIKLGWSPSTGATSYNVKRSTSPNTETTIASTSATSFTDTSLTNGVTYFYVVTAMNPGGENPTNSPELSVTAPTPPPPPPTIGWFDYEGSTVVVSVFHQVSGNPFTNYNDLDLAIEGNASGISTLYTYDGTVPGTNNGSSSTPPTYADGSPNTDPPVPFLPVTPMPVLTIKAVNLSLGGSSPVSTAEFVSQVGIPNKVGNNAAQFTISDVTSNAQLYYTTDGTTPSPINGVGPLAGGTSLSLQFPPGVSNLTFAIRGFKANYLPSAVATYQFSLINYLPNAVSFGFASGPGSCQFVASPGQSFTVPVGLSLLPAAPSIYGLQFNVTLTNLAGPVVDSTTVDFGSLIGQPDSNDPGYFDEIPPYMFISTFKPSNDPNALPYANGWYQNLVFADTNNEDLLGVGWLEVYGRTNLYNTLSQNLLTYPILRGNDPYPTASPIIGYYTFQIPPTAVTGSVYQIQLGLPSATTFNGVTNNPYGLPVVIEAPADTNKVGPGTVNALKHITIGSIPYLVGDVYPANWFNAGDFGSSNLLVNGNLDAIRVFDFAAYPIAAPPPGSDLFDALDSSGNFGVLDSDPADPKNGYLTNTATYPKSFSYFITDYTDYVSTNGTVVTSIPSPPIGPISVPIYLTTYTVNEAYNITYITTNQNLTVTTNTVQQNNFVPITPGDSTLFSGSDSSINQIAFGDGVLDVCDVYVTFRRSLDTNNLVWVQRQWVGGQRVAMTNWAPTIIPTVLQSSPGGPIQSASGIGQTSATPPSVTFQAGDSVTTAGNTVQIPITTAAFGQYPLRVALLNLTVVPLDGSPALTSKVSFSPGKALGAPTSIFINQNGNANYAAAWMDSTIAGISNNTAVVGTLNVPIPASATSMSAYAVHFDSASGSPNGLASLPMHTMTGLITLSSRTNSYYHDGIPDSWRLRWFGTIYNLLSVSNACPSGDRVNNWNKYVAGVDPNAANDFPALIAKQPVPAGATAAIHWPTVLGKQYVILRSTSLFPGSWTSILTNTGTGTDMEFDDTTAGKTSFYRVQILP